MPDIIEIEDKRAEHALFENEERHRTLFDLAPSPSILVMFSGVIRDYNNRAAELWSRKPELGDTDERFLRLVQAVPPRRQFYATRAVPCGRCTDWQGAGHA